MERCKTESGPEGLFRISVITRSLLIAGVLSLGIPARAQDRKFTRDTRQEKGRISIETAPPYWLLTLRNGFAFSGCVSYKLKQNPRIRLGILGYTGRWKEQVDRFLLTKDFTGDQWEAQWDGLALETHYQFPLGLTRGGLLAGLRTQWNHITYYEAGKEKARADHLMMTPQLGFQWFLHKKAGLYLLPWVGYMADVAGSDKVNIDGMKVNTRKRNAIVTFQIGWEFKL